MNQTEKDFNRRLKNYVDNGLPIKFNSAGPGAPLEITLNLGTSEFKFTMPVNADKLDLITPAILVAEHYRDLVKKLVSETAVDYSDFEIDELDKIRKELNDEPV